MCFSLDSPIKCYVQNVLGPATFDHLRGNKWFHCKRFTHFRLEVLWKQGNYSVTQKKKKWISFLFFTFWNYILINCRITKECLWTWQLPIWGSLSSKITQKSTRFPGQKFESWALNERSTSSSFILRVMWVILFVFGTHFFSATSSYVLSTLFDSYILFVAIQNYCCISVSNFSCKKKLILVATVWKFQVFSIPQILREINVEDSRGAKSAIY